MSIWQRLTFLVPSVRRAEERDTQESLQAMAAEGHESLGNLTRAAEQRREAWDGRGSNSRCETCGTRCEPCAIVRRLPQPSAKVFRCKVFVAVK